MPEILRSIGTIARALDSISNIEFKQYDLTKGQYLYLVRIYEHPGIITDHLANLLTVDRTTAARAVQKLVNQGFVRKQSATNNRKNKELYLTEQGAQVYPHIQRENTYSNQVALTDLTPSEATELAALLAKVSNRVTADFEQVKKGQTRPYPH